MAAGNSLSRSVEAGRWKRRDRVAELSWALTDSRAAVHAFRKTGDPAVGRIFEMDMELSKSTSIALSGGDTEQHQWRNVHRRELCCGLFRYLHRVEDP